MEALGKIPQVPLNLCKLENHCLGEPCNAELPGWYLWLYKEKGDSWEGGGYFLLGRTFHASSVTKVIT